MLMCFLFFFVYTARHRDIHSFPTRRSSDLNVYACDDMATKNAATAPRIVLDRMKAANDRRRRDRKSTRLNSSHRCISYAVFCLKKKNNQQLYYFNHPQHDVLSSLRAITPYY